jgi:lipopolysaccharide/colanic/teichoic acid biosynthesis glycosyltransferase
VFDIYKFRSMTHEAERSKASLRNESNGALFKVRQDPRVTRVGRIIRRYSIDELPQLINIFKGDMSLVGPRPLPVEDFMHLSEEDKMGTLYHHRSAMKPGLTGLWQISGRSDLGFREMLLLDIYYIENHTHLFDLEILLRTIPAVLFARGAY